MLGPPPHLDSSPVARLFPSQLVAAEPTPHFIKFQAPQAGSGRQLGLLLRCDAAGAAVHQHQGVQVRPGRQVRQAGRAVESLLGQIKGLVTRLSH